MEDPMRILLCMLALTLSAPAMADTAKPAGSQPGADKDKLICKREVPIGSLIATRKICLTKTEWEARATRGNEEARR
jgi:hypothetical protein